MARYPECLARSYKDFVLLFLGSEKLLATALEGTFLHIRPFFFEWIMENVDILMSHGRKQTVCRPVNWRHLRILMGEEEGRRMGEPLRMGFSQPSRSTEPNIKTCANMPRYPIYTCRTCGLSLQ